MVVVALMVCERTNMGLGNQLTEAALTSIVTVTVFRPERWLAKLV